MGFACRTEGHRHGHVEFDAGPLACSLLRTSNFNLVSVGLNGHIYLQCDTSVGSAYSPGWIPASRLLTSPKRPVHHALLFARYNLRRPGRRRRLADRKNRSLAQHIGQWLGDIRPSRGLLLQEVQSQKLKGARRLRNETSLDGEKSAP